MNSLRMEKGYRHWGHDITDEDTPLEAGLAFAVTWEKPAASSVVRRCSAERTRDYPPAHQRGVRRFDEGSFYTPSQSLEMDGSSVGSHPACLAIRSESRWGWAMWRTAPPC